MTIGPEKRARLVESIRNYRPPQSRFFRAMLTPWKTTSIVGMRVLRRQRDVVCQLIWDDQFYGAIPEAVTSLVWRHKLYEAKTTLFLLNYLKPGAVFVDVGAHFGYFSLLGSRLVGAGGNVLSIEAMPNTYAMLQRNLTGNNIQNVTALNIAGSDEDGELVFRDFGIVNSSLNTMFLPRGTLQDTKQSGAEVRVTGKRLDAVIDAQLDRRVDMIKVDAESSEENVLRGLDRTLRNHQPVVIVELGGGDSAEDERAKRIVDLMRQYGHRPYAFDGRTLHEIKILENLPYVNAFFMTENHAAQMSVGADFDDTDDSV